MNRKGKVEERKPLLMLFNDEVVQCLLTAAKTQPVALDEQNYLFKKKLIQVKKISICVQFSLRPLAFVQVLAGLGTQLCTLWGKDSVSRPANFSMFLDAILAFSNHPSLTLAQLANPIWNSMLKHEHISRDPIFLSYIPQWVQCTAPKIIKVNFPSGKVPNLVSDPSAYAKMDFDSEEEYSSFFHKCRSSFLETFR